MSKQFSQFPNGNPPQDTDRILIGRVDGSSASGYSNYHVTWAQLVAALGGTVTPSYFLLGDGASYILLGDGSSKLRM